MTQKILTLQGVSDRTGIPVNTLRFFRSTSRGPKTFKLGGRVVALEEDVDAWILEAYEATADSEPA